MSVSYAPPIPLSDDLSIVHERPTAGDLMVFRELLPIIINLVPIWSRRRLMDIMPFKALKEMKVIVDTLYDKCASIYTEKRRALDEEKEANINGFGKAKDIMSVLRECFNSVRFEARRIIFISIVRSNMASADEDRLTEEEVIGQMK